MFDKETLARVTDYKSSVNVASKGVTQTTAGPPSGTQAEKPDAEPERKAKALDGPALEKVLGNLSAHVQNLQRSLHFSVDKASGETVVRVIDTETKEVIRQIPTEELLVIAERLRETAGLLVSERA